MNVKCRLCDKPRARFYEGRAEVLICVICDTALVKEGVADLVGDTHWRSTLYGPPIMMARLRGEV